jgi:hypothetical protein
MLLIIIFSIKSKIKIRTISRLFSWLGWSLALPVNGTDLRIWEGEAPAEPTHSDIYTPTSNPRLYKRILTN